MPIITTTSGLGVQASFAGATEFEADLTVEKNLVSKIGCSTSIFAELSNTFDIAAIVATETDIFAFLRLNNETNVFIEAEIESLTTVVANLTSQFVPFANFAGSTTIVADLRQNQALSAALNLIVDIYPPAAPLSRWRPRLKIDGVEIPIISGVYNEAAGTAGADLQVTLARLADKELITAGSVFEFGFGRKVSGAWDEATFETLLQDGLTDSTGHTISWQAGPTDSFTLKIVSNVREQLGKTPETDLIIYDSSRLTLNSADIPVLVDTETRQYPAELRPIAGFTLYDLFQEIFVTRCGFSGFKTNIPDFSLARIDCPIGRPLLESIRGHFGMFNPVIFEADGEVWILDTTIIMPPGFPSPRTVNTSAYETLSVDSARSRLDGLRVQYVEDAREFDAITTRTETKTETHGTFGDPDYTTTFIQRLYRQYLRFTNPGVPVREELYHEERITSDAFNTIFESREDRLFDSNGRFYNRTKTEHQRLPDVQNDGDMTLMQTAAETELLSFALHPFQPRAQFIQRREMKTSGLIMIDSENPQLGQAFQMDYQEARRKGNLIAGQTTRFGVIRTLAEDNEPLRNGQVRIKVFEVDHIANQVVRDFTEDRSGDVSLNGLALEQNEILVFDDENTTRTTNRIETVHAGEMPLVLAVPWARRNLRARKLKGRKIQVNVIGYDAGLRKGIPITPTGRTPAGGSLETIGNFLILGRSIPFGAEGVSMNLTCNEI